MTNHSVSVVSYVDFLHLLLFFLSGYFILQRTVCFSSPLFPVKNNFKCYICIYLFPPKRKTDISYPDEKKKYTYIPTYTSYTLLLTSLSCCWATKAGSDAEGEAGTGRDLTDCDALMLCQEVVLPPASGGLRPPVIIIMMEPFHQCVLPIEKLSSP